MVSLNSVKAEIEAEYEQHFDEARKTEAAIAEEVRKEALIELVQLREQLKAAREAIKNARKALKKRKLEIEEHLKLIDVLADEEDLDIEDIFDLADQAEDLHSPIILAVGAEPQIGDVVAKLTEALGVEDYTYNRFFSVEIDPTPIAA